MKRPDPDQRDILAGEYAIGTLDGPARQRYERLRAEDAVYCHAVDDWENRLAPLVEALPSREPPDSVWAGIERGLEGPSDGERRGRRWRLTVAIVAGLLALLALAAIVF